jgi:hypothetical protein
MSFGLSLTNIFLMANALLLGIALLVIIRFRREAKALLAFWQSPTGAVLVGEHAQNPGHVACDQEPYVQSVMRLEHQMLLLRRDFERLASTRLAPDARCEERVARPRALPIENAVRMARLGASEEELTRTCGLSLGEARLMKKLHGKSPTTH